jgi:alkanesulfonate monooxygenase SsuD/methylene tetrahydromethanopterin reductase-like flavin-dependent oxidoreductase (luciferase family)
MRFGVSVPNAGDATQLVNLAVTAEEAGWDGFFLWDHLQLDALRRPPMHDPWVLLGAIAARTSRVRLGTMITPIPRRRPWKLAKEIITLDHLSAGRVIVGVGLGVPAEAEYGAFGEPTGTRLRAAMLDEALPILDSFLCGEPLITTDSTTSSRLISIRRRSSGLGHQSGSPQRCRTASQSHALHAGTASSH